MDENLDYIKCIKYFSNAKTENKGLNDDEVKELVIKQLKYYNDKENLDEIDILKIEGFILLFKRLATVQEYINNAIDIPIIRKFK